ncbi:SRPBCC family protein [Pimelobacter sp. 30-1]|uniref:SRPBCC family protein n=1 Tax=Pimelobacter sp. 30-1 TaxID=2004991 RepID=UPI001C0576E8|nr:SRPBCC family protein [Pimelobacter sp. 30-1]MBU2698707.1 hypothetical protein [Pimelobacter sp. 30-1]
MARSGERAVGGRTSGELALGESVTWRAGHVGIPFRMTVAITEHQVPGRFVDEQVRGPFGRWHHEHLFAADAGGRTRMTDRISFASPLGPVGVGVDRLFLTGYLTRLVRTRNTWLRQRLEGG